MNPRTAYIVCTSARSGSGVLCEALWLTKRAGEPDEYFGRFTIPIYWEKWQARDNADYLRRMVSRTTTANGIFGVKIHASHVPFVDEMIPRSPQNSTATGLDRLVELWPHTRFVWLRRREKARQAISAWRAEVSGKFVRRLEDPDPRPEFRFDFERVLSRYKAFEENDRFWQEFFHRHQVEPLHLVYEDDLEHDFRVGARRVLEWIGVENVDDIPIESTFRKQSDAVSEHAYLLFKKMLGERRASQLSQ